MVGTLIGVLCEIGSATPYDSDVSDSNLYAYDSNYARSAVAIRSSAGKWAKVVFSEDADELWFMFEADMSWIGTGTSSLSTLWILTDEFDNAKLRCLHYRATTAITLQYWNGSAWVTINSSTADLAIGQRLDFHIKVNSVSGHGALYVGGDTRFETDVDLSGISHVSRFYAYSPTSGSVVTAWSQGAFLKGTENTINKKLMTWRITGAGSSNGFTLGNYASVNEITHNDGTNLESDTANQEAMFAGGVVGSLGGRNVHTVGVAARAREDSTGPGNMQVGVRTNATNYWSDDIAVSVGYGQQVAFWPTNPDTGLAWGLTVPDEIGVKSIA